MAILRLQAHEAGQRLRLKIPGVGKDNRDIIAWKETEDGGVEAVIMGDDARSMTASDLEEQGIEILRVLDKGEETKGERVARIGRSIGRAGLGAVT